MMAYFKSRTPREQGLIAGMLILAALFALWLFVFKPVFTMKDSAERAQAAALRDYDIVRKGAPMIAAKSGAASGNAAFDRSVIVTLAAEQSLPISRLQSEPDGALKIWFEGVDAARVFTLLSNLTAGYAAQIEGVQISRREGGTVSAQLTLRGI